MTGKWTDEDQRLFDEVFSLAEQQIADQEAVTGEYPMRSAGYSWLVTPDVMDMLERARAVGPNPKKPIEMFRLPVSRSARKREDDLDIMLMMVTTTAKVEAMRRKARQTQ